MAPPKSSHPGRAAAAASRKRNQELARLAIVDDDADESIAEEVTAQPGNRRRTRATARDKETDDHEIDDGDINKHKDAEINQYEQAAAQHSNTMAVPLPLKVIPTAKLPTLISCFFNQQCFTHEVLFAFRECGSIAAIQKLVDKHFQPEWQRVDLPDTTIFVQLNCFAPKRSLDLDDDDAHMPCRSEDAYQDWWQNMMESRMYVGERARIQVCLDTDAFMATDKERLKGWPTRAGENAAWPIDNMYGPRWVRKSRTAFEKSLSGVAEPLDWEDVQQGAELERELEGVIVKPYIFRQNERKGERYQEVMVENLELKKQSNEERKERDEAEKAASKREKRLLAILREYGIRVRKEESGLHTVVQ